MAPAVSTPTRPVRLANGAPSASDGEGEPGLDWKGDDVTIGEVLNALNEARRKFAIASAGEGDGDHPHPRNCVMTLIAVAADEKQEQHALRSAMDIAQHHPSLTIVIRDQPNEIGRASCRERV